MLEAKTLRNLLVCTSVTTCILYIFQISFGVSALKRFYGLRIIDDEIAFNKAETVGMKMIEFFMFLIFSIFLVVGLVFKTELLRVNILGYVLLIGVQAYTTIASFDTTARIDLGEMPNYCQLLDSGDFLNANRKEVAQCRIALASGIFIFFFNIISLFLTIGILEKNVANDQVALAVPVAEQEVEKSV